MTYTKGDLQTSSPITFTTIVSHPAIAKNIRDHQYTRSNHLLMNLITIIKLMISWKNPFQGLPEMSLKLF